MKTERGFQYVAFEDKGGHVIQIQQSSATDGASEPGHHALWFGPASADPKRLVPGEGWKPFELPPDVLLSTRAHLDRQMVEKVVEHLQNWLKTGEFE